MGGHSKCRNIFQVVLMMTKGEYMRIAQRGRRIRESLVDDKGANIQRPRGRLPWNGVKENARERDG